MGTIFEAKGLRSEYSDLLGNKTYACPCHLQVSQRSDKNEEAIMSTAFYQRLRARNSKVNRQVWPEFEVFRDFMAFLVTCKFDDHPIKNVGAIVSSIISLQKNYDTQEQVIP